MQTIDTLVTELAQAEQRIAALESALRTLVADDFDTWGSDWTESHWHCRYCHAEGADINDEPNKDDHKPDCPWRAAQALVGIE